MLLSETSDCFSKGLLKRIEKSPAFARQDFERADFFLGEARELAEMKKTEMAFIALYNAPFHSARALLYLDGVKEKSHYCLQKYVEEKYGGPGLLDKSDLALFDLLRTTRQEVQYGLYKTTAEEDAFGLCNKTQKLLNKAKYIVQHS